MVLTSGSALDSGDGDGSGMRESVSEALTKALSSLPADVVVDTSSSFIPDDIQKSSVFHPVERTSSPSSDDVLDSQVTPSSSDISPSVMISTTGESSSLHLIKLTSSPDYLTETPSLPIDHLQSSPSHLTDDMTSSVTSRKSTDETVTNPLPPTPDTNSNTYAKQTLFEHEIMYPISIACLSISVLALTVRISLQFIITGIRNRPNKLQFQLSIAMLASFVGMLSSPLLVDILEACTVLSVCLLYFFTAALSWMTVIAVDTWTVFRPSAAFLRPDEEGTSLVVHYLCGWGIPVLVPMVTIAGNYLNINDKFKPKLGGSNCLYEDEFAMITFLGIPLVILTLISILFYVLTAVNLKNALGKSAKAKTVRSQLRIHVRLLCIMLVTWIFGLISPFAEHCILDFIFLVLSHYRDFLYSFLSSKTKQYMLKYVIVSRKEYSLKEKMALAFPH